MKLKLLRSETKTSESFSFTPGGETDMKLKLRRVSEGFGEVKLKPLRVSVFSLLRTN